MAPARISAAIQHHPARATLLPQLAAALAPLVPDVVADPDPDAAIRSPWRTYRRALDLTPAWATHRLVVQDDAVPYPGFAATLERAVAARPDRLLVLCVCGQPADVARAVGRALAAGTPWVELRRPRWIPTVALVWPADLISRATAFVDSARWPRQFTADDEIVRRVMEGLDEQALATAPSLVEHRGDVPSVVRTARTRSTSRNPGRETAWPPPPGLDLAALDWA